MQIIPLYRYTRPGGGVTVSTIKPECEHTEKIRLVADEDKMLTVDGEALYGCADVESVEGWYEVDAPIDVNYRME